MARRHPMITTLFITAVLLAGGILLPGPVAAGATSPFSLDSATAAKQAVPSSNPPAQTAPASPFALPPKTAKAPDPALGAGDSPFALPAPGKPAAGNAGVQPGQEAAPPPAADRSAEQLLAQGLAQAKGGQLEEARASLAQAVEKDPGNVVALNNLGLVLRKLARLDDALAAYQKALQIDATYALTYKNLGVLQEKRGQHELAIQAYREYYRLSPAAPDAKDVAARADWLEKNSISRKK